MPFTVEVYSKGAGICVDRVKAHEIHAEGDWYKIYPTHDEGYKGPKEYRIDQYELTTRSFLTKGKTLHVKNRFDPFPWLYPNVYSYKKVDMPDGLEFLRVEYRPWGQDTIKVHMMAMSMIDYWEEK